MSAELISGKDMAATIREEVEERVARLKERGPGFTPGLAVVLLGEDPASQVYVRSKNKAATEAFRIGFTGMINDPAMISQMKKATGSVMTPVAIEVALNVYENLKNVDPKLVKFSKEYNAEGSKAKKAPKDKRGGKRKKKN